MSKFNTFPGKYSIPIVSVDNDTMKIQKEIWDVNSHIFENIVK